MRLSNDLFWGFFGFLTVKLVFNLAMLYIIFKRLELKRPDLTITRKFLTYSWPLTFSNLAGGILTKADRYFISYFLGPAATGGYNIIYSAASFVDTYTVPLRKNLSVYLPKIWDRGEHGLVKERVSQALLYYFVFSSGSLVGIALLLRPLAKFVFDWNPDKFANLEWLVGIVGLGIIALGVSRMQFHILHLKELTKKRLLFQIMGAIMNVIVNFLLIPEIGLMGAALATFISYLMVIVLAHSVTKLDFRKDLFVRKLLKTFLLCILLAAGLVFLPKSDISTFAMSLSIGAIFYLGAIYLTGVISRDEITRLLFDHS